MLPTCADEQGLGKTCMCLALIVTRPPTAADARKALDTAKKSHESMQLHPLGSAARAARAAQLGLSAAQLGQIRSAVVVGVPTCLCS